jgi:ribosome biogenesis GTPase
MIGLVVQTHNRFYQVRCDQRRYLCSLKGNFKKAEPEYRLPVVGDQVRIALKKSEKEGVDGYLTEILERDNALIRNLGDGRRMRVMAANLDCVFIVSAVKQPGVDWGIVDRYVAACEMDNIPHALVINKIELDPDFANDPHLDIYRNLDIPVLLTSVKANQGLDELKQELGKGISLLTGTSGVGKSSLVNCLVPQSELATAEVDRKHGMGRHTTTSSMLIPLPGGGFLADSPGLRDFSPPLVDPEELRFGFREFRELQSGCRFSTCMHVNEPGCAVIRALEKGGVNPLRHRHYLQTLEEMQQYRQQKYS